MLLAAVLTAATLTMGGPAVSTVPVAAPRIIMFHGGELGDRRLHMVDWWENLALMQALSDADRAAAELTGNDRPYVDVALFRDDRIWGDIARDSTRWRTLDPTRRDVGSGRLYLARDGQRPILVYKTAKGAKAISDGGLMILRRYGVPVE